jgi:23S rRNA (adenine2503-C2)-methyltransferase
MIPAMKHFLENSECHLAVSMHTPFHEERRKLMPVENVYPIADVMELLRSFDLGKQRRISFEYIMFKGINDTPRHVKEISRLLNGLRCRINLIRFHPIPDTPLQSSSEEIIQEFREALVKRGIRTTVRASRGQDIFAACGLLSTKELVKMQAPDF